MKIELFLIIVFDEFKNNCFLTYFIIKYIKIYKQN